MQVVFWVVVGRSAQLVRLPTWQAPRRKLNGWHGFTLAKSLRCLNRSRP